MLFVVAELTGQLQVPYSVGPASSWRRHVLPDQVFNLKLAATVIATTALGPVKLFLSLGVPVVNPSHHRVPINSVVIWTKMVPAFWSVCPASKIGTKNALFPAAQLNLPAAFHNESFLISIRRAESVLIRTLGPILGRASCTGTSSPGASRCGRPCGARYGHGWSGRAIIPAVMNNISRRAVLFCIFLLVLQSVALLSHSEFPGVHGTTPPEFQDGVAVSSSEGSLATWERRLDAPVGYGIGTEPRAPMITYNGMLRRPW